MSESPFAVPGAKLTLVLSLVMTLFGFVGVSRSLVLLAAPTDQRAPAFAVGTPEVREAVQGYDHAIAESPVTRAVAIANLLASALLMIGSFLMTARSRAALWWASQAFYGNIGYSFAAAAASVYLASVHRDRIDALALAASQGSGVSVDVVGSMYYVALVGGAIVFALFVSILYFVLLRLCRRQDVQRFVRREA